MTYFGFLARFVLVPLALLVAAACYDAYRRMRRPDTLSGFPAWLALALHVLVALLYTTPWDNYLVATRVWWYDPQLVTGIRDLGHHLPQVLRCELNRQRLEWFCRCRLE